MITQNTKNIGTALAIQAITIIAIFSLINPLQADTITTAGKGTFITESFSCKVALADYAELQRVLELTPRTDFKYKMFLSQFETVTIAMTNNNCEVK